MVTMVTVAARRRRDDRQSATRVSARFFTSHVESRLDSFRFVEEISRNRPSILIVPTSLFIQFGSSTRSLFSASAYITHNNTPSSLSLSPPR